LNDRGASFGQPIGVGPCFKQVRFCVVCKDDERNNTLKNNGQTFSNRKRFRVCIKSVLVDTTFFLHKFSFW
jgi:hypothetical protein